MNKRVAGMIVNQFRTIFGAERINPETIAGFESIAEMLHEGTDGQFVAQMLESYIVDALSGKFAESITDKELALLHNAMVEATVKNVLAHLISPPLPSFLPSEVPPKAKAALEAELKRRKAIGKPGRN